MVDADPHFSGLDRRAIKRTMTLAFSLVEIVLAVGIISFALVGILGMFPVALDAATRSREETQAAFIARSIYSDLAGYPSYLSPDEDSVISLACPHHRSLASTTRVVLLRLRRTLWFGDVFRGDRVVCR